MNAITQMVWIILDFIAVLTFGVLAYQTLIYPKKRWQQSEESLKWPSAPGVVVASYLKRHDRSGGGSYETPHISYEYTVAGKRYKSTRFSFDDIEKLAVTEAQLKTILANYPKGKELTVYYDPQNPKSSILFPKVTRPQVRRNYAIVGIVFSLTGIFFAIKLIIDLLQYFK